jgi:hypothetical protein
MADKTVQLIIGRVFTDAACRNRFAADPGERLSTVHESGSELTRLEFEAVSRTSRELGQRGPDWATPRLQRCA